MDKNEMYFLEADDILNEFEAKNDKEAINIFDKRSKNQCSSCITTMSLLKDEDGGYIMVEQYNLKKESDILEEDKEFGLSNLKLIK